MLCECLLCALIEVEVASAGARAIGTAAAASPARRIGIGVVVTVVGRRHFVVVVGMVSNIVEFVFGRSSGRMQFVMVIVGESDYILFAPSRGVVGVVHRSRVGWRRGFAGIRSGIFLGGFRNVG